MEILKIYLLSCFFMYTSLCSMSPDEKQFFEAVHNDDVIKLQDALNKGIDVNLKAMIKDLNFITSDKTTALHVAVEHNAKKAAQLLLNQKNIKVNELNNDGSTPLQEAIWVSNNNDFGNDLDIINLLLKHPDIDTNIRDYIGFTPLQIATILGNFDIVDLLKSTPSNDPKDSILFDLVNSNDTTKLQNFLNTTDINTQDSAGFTLLMWAVLLGQAKVVEYLLKDKNINVNLKDNADFTPFNRALEYGFRQGEWDVAKLLLQDPNTDINAFSHHDLYPPLFYMSYNLDTLKSALKRPYIDLNLQNALGNTALLEMLSPQPHTPLADFKDAIKLLLDHPKTNLNIKNKNGETALDLANLTKDTVIIDLLKTTTNKSYSVDALALALEDIK